MRKLLFLIPAYNEESTIEDVVKLLPQKIKRIDKVQIAVVDDGSTDLTSKLLKGKKIILLRHVINRGLGASLATGFTYAKKYNFDFMITLDADGQHDVRDIPSLLKPLLNEGTDVVIGSRLLNNSTMPPARKLVNTLSNIATWLLFSIWTTDSQSGMRGFNKRAISKIKIKSQRMEVSSEIFKEINRFRLSLKEVPIKTIYTSYSLNKGQRISNAPNVFIKLLLQRFS